ncbi:hypothetical protein [Enterococcus sp. 5B3_DIV0040]|uniref:hypothetical protein n=1 Tax=Enterococcus sp. 5B3_DIV0040 TaxID=1834182 RepID=UPI000A353D6A|nr:hypothetical protein [Enterococcus sp. 5B3_DIV0040]OTO02233.1 hypothetical protein A5883_003060 [Enterococcus sp. 5B3_DIV0040]
MKEKITIFMAFETEEDSLCLDVPVHCLVSVNQGVMFLEKANRELLAAGKAEELTYFLYEDEKQELPTWEASIQLPITEGTISDALRASFSDLTNESSDVQEEAQAFFRVFTRNLPDKNKEKATSKKKPKGAFSERASPPEKEFPHVKRKRRGLWLLLLSLTGLCLFVGGVWIGITVFSPPVSTDEQHAFVSLEHQVQSQGKLETFSRYFLTNYYTGTTEKEQVQEKVRRFVSEELLDQISGQEAQLKSAFPWERKAQKGSWKVSYIVVLQTDKDPLTTKKVTFQLKEEQEKLFVTTIPKEEPFEMNQ